MQTKAVFVADTRSLYYGVKNKFPGHSLSYLDLIDKFQEQNNMLFAFKLAFGKYEAVNSHKFHTLLVETGFEVFFDRKYYDAELALRVARVLPHVDAVVLATCWFAHYPVLEFAKEQGKITHCIGVNLPSMAKYFCKPFEITQEFLRKKPEVEPEGEQ